MAREILKPYAYDDPAFPENPALPEGAREVRWQDSFGYGVAFRPDIVYAERDGEKLTISYLTPRNDRRDNPLIVFVQGSAWFRQDIYIHLPEMLRMCQRGYCVALVQYRPSTTAKFPAQTEDVKTAIRFLEGGDKVKVSIRFRGRQITHSEIGMKVMTDFAQRCQEVSTVERRPLMDGRHMIMILAPKAAKASFAEKKARKEAEAKEKAASSEAAFYAKRTPPCGGVLCFMGNYSSEAASISVSGALPGLKSR